jgi:predicted DNA-binding protein
MEEPQNFTAFVQTRCTADLRESLEQLAAKDRRSLANYIRVVLEAHVRERTEAVKSEDRAA